MSSAAPSGLAPSASHSTSIKDFKVSMLLGKGSFGSVYKCKRRSDGL
jgi:hypothetical protein